MSDLIKEEPTAVTRRSPTSAWAQSIPCDGEWYRFPDAVPQHSRATALRYCDEVRTTTRTAAGVQSPAHKVWLYARKVVPS